MDKFVIIGAGGHGKVIADIILNNGCKNICFVDDNIRGDVMGFPVVGTIADIESLDDGRTGFIIGIGNNALRRQIAQKYRIPFVSVVHPSAQIAFGVKIGNGTAVMANAVINTCATLGEHCIVNTGAVVEHDNVIEDYVHLSPNVTLGGTVHIGALTHVGIGAIVKNNVDICADCVIGAGAVVVKNIEQSGTYIGVPAR